MSAAKTVIEQFAKRQGEGNFPCPRCGMLYMDEQPTRNALSRRADVQICDQCGTVEALEDLTSERIPLEAWAIVNHPEKFRTEDADNESA